MTLLFIWIIGALIAAWPLLKALKKELPQPEDNFSYCVVSFVYLTCLVTWPVWVGVVIFSVVGRLLFSKKSSVWEK